MRQKKVSEKDVRKAVRDLLKKTGFLVIPYIPGFYGNKGVSDLLCCGTVDGVPGRFVAIELKATTGKPSPDQLDFIRQVKERGGIAFVARSTEDVIRHLKLPVLL
jgi:hypothetical protein